MQRLSASRLRANLYRLLDRVLASGEPMSIERKSGRVLITPERHHKLAMLKPHPQYLKGSPDEIVHMDWSEEWHP